MAMGFLDKSAPECARVVPDGDAFLRFDSGRGITFDEALRHTGVFGSSGTGKTVQVVAPAMKACIESGATTYIMDPKGNLAGYARSFAQACGRAGDIIEYGTTPSSIPINILEGMTPSRFYNFLMGMIRAYMDDGKSGNMDFHASCANAVRDVFILLTHISGLAGKSGVELPVTLPLILELCGNPRQATQIFEKFMQAAELSDDIRSFAQRVLSNMFHILNQKEDAVDSDHQMQRNFHSLSAIQAMTGFLEEEGIAEKFCHSGSPGLNPEALIGKITILSFGAGAAGAAARLCRTACETFYSWIYKQGVGGPKKFIIVDEFQEICDLSARRLSDASFIALAREFNCGFLMATQSYSALTAKYGAAGLESLAANLNNKIFLHTEDILTRDAASALGSPDLIDLQKDAFAATYDNGKRGYVYGVETLNDSFAKTMAAAPVNGEPVIVDARKHKPEEVQAFLEDLIEEKTKEKAREKEMEYEPEMDSFTENTATPPLTDYDRDVEEYVSCLEEPARRKESRNQMMPGDISLAYSGLFSKNAVICVPAGWMGFLKSALNLFSSLNLKVSIDRIEFTRKGWIEADGFPCGSIQLLNNLLELSVGVCAKCGAEMEPNRFHLCGQCMKSLPKLGEEKRCNRNPF